MNAKDKAKELLKEFSYYVDCTSDWGEYDIGKELENSKQCAKIAVEEIIQNDEYLYLGRKKNTQYWNEVLKEIDLL